MERKAAGENMLISLLGTCLAAITLDGTLETIEDVEAVWQLPATTPSNIMLLAHGCNHGSIDFWPRSPKCAQCIGLPEEMRIVSTALERGWAVVAFSSIDRQFRRCWNFHEDGPRVTRALGAFRKQHWGLEKAAVTALGASSGGAFVLQLPQLLPLKAVVSQIMAIPPQARSPRLSLAPARPRAGRRVADQGPAAAGPPPQACRLECRTRTCWTAAIVWCLLPQMLRAAADPYPPTLFVHMSRDEHTEAIA